MTQSRATADFQSATKNAEKSTPKSRKAKSGHRVTIRLTDEEYETLTQRSAGISASAYIRESLFGENVSSRKVKRRQPIKGEKALAQVLGLLGQTHYANNLNQLAYHANTGSLLMDEETEKEIKLTCARIAWMRVKLIEALGLKPDIDT